MSWVLITGGAQKLGRALALALAKEHPIAIQYCESGQEAEELQRLIQASGGRSEIIFGDFSTQKGVEDFLISYQKRCGRTKALLNNASAYLFGSFLTTPFPLAEELWQCNFLAPLLLARALAPFLAAEKGCIVNLGVAGIFKALADTRTSFYTLSKLSLWMLTQSLAKELAAQNIRVNMVSPGYLTGSVDAPGSLEQIPMKRLGNYEEVASIVAFLLDPKNSYITGQNIEVAGGVRL